MSYDPTKSLGQRFQDAFLEAWGDERLVAFAALPAPTQAKWDRAAVSFVAGLSDAPALPQTPLSDVSIPDQVGLGGEADHD